MDSHVFGAIEEGSDSSSEHRSPAVGATPLHTAVLKRELDVVREILNAGEPNWWRNLLHNKMRNMDKDGMCPIHLAAKLEDCGIIEEFMDSVPDCVHFRNKDYKTPLHVAVENKRLEAVKKILHLRNDEEAQRMVGYDYDIEGNTALHLAASNAVEQQIVRELLKWPGTNVNAVNQKGLTALDIAAHFSEVELERDRRINYENIKKILQAVGGTGRQGGQSEEESNMVNVDTLVASLIATIIFAAIFQVPGGIEDDRRTEQYEAARLAMESIFQCFLICDALALFTSLTVVIAWLLRERMQIIEFYKARSIMATLSAVGLGASIISTGLAFLCATFLVIIPRRIRALETGHEKAVEAYIRIWNSVTVAAYLVPAFTVIATLVTLTYHFLLRHRENPALRRLPHVIWWLIFCTAFILPQLLLTYNNLGLI